MIGKKRRTNGSPGPRFTNGGRGKAKSGSCCSPDPICSVHGDTTRPWYGRMHRLPYLGLVLTLCKIDKEVPATPRKERVRAMSVLRTTYLARFSKPTEDRAIYRTIQKSGAKRFVEIGIERAVRSQRMIEMAAAETPLEDIVYTGIDPFEGRGEIDGLGLSLKKAHHVLRETGARIRLLPGDPLRVLARSANNLGSADILLIATPRAARGLDRAWFYIPRILAPTGVVFLAEHEGTEVKSFRSMTADEARNEAAIHTKRHAA